MTRGIVPLVICGRGGDGGALSRLAVLEDVFGLEAGKASRGGVPVLARLEDQLEAEARRPHVKLPEPTREVVLAGGSLAVHGDRLLGEQVTSVRSEQLIVGCQAREGLAAELRGGLMVRLR